MLCSRQLPLPDGTTPRRPRQRIGTSGCDRWPRAIWKSSRPTRSSRRPEPMALSSEGPAQESTARTPLPLALTCGEPAGIGPEIAVKARAVLGPRPAVLPDRRSGPCARATAWPRSTTRPRPPTSRPRCCRCCRTPSPRRRRAGPARPAPMPPAVIEVDRARGATWSAGRPRRRGRHHPDPKKALKDGAGFAYPGHTEYLADLAGVEPGGDDAGLRTSCAWCR